MLQGLFFFYCARYPEWRPLYRLWHSLLFCENGGGMCGEKHDPTFQTQPLSFRPMLIPPLPRSHIPMVASVVLVVCVCVWVGRGLLLWSLFIPGSQLTHEVMVVTSLFVGSAALIPFVSSAAHSQMMQQERRWWWATVCALMCWDEWKSGVGRIVMHAVGANA